MTYIHAAQKHITDGYVYLDVPGEDETFTFPYEPSWRDGQWINGRAESVLGGSFRYVTFRFMR